MGMGKTSDGVVFCRV